MLKYLIWLDYVLINRFISLCIKMSLVLILIREITFYSLHKPVTDPFLYQW